MARERDVTPKCQACNTTRNNPAERIFPGRKTPIMLCTPCFNRRKADARNRTGR